MNRTAGHRALPLIYLLTFIAGLVWSAISPQSYVIWLAEIGPAIIVVIFLVITCRSFPLTPMLYSICWISFMLMLIGGHYTYENVPLFNTIRDTFHLSRNHYDRLGHIAQGIVPAFTCRELLLRFGIMTNRKWLFFVAISFTLAFSAIYEILEFAAVKISGADEESFLGMQGDIWDAQWDMLCALIGALIALLLFSKWHNRQIQALELQKKEN